MDPGMAIRASGIKSPGGVKGDAAAFGTVYSMAHMALQAQKGLAGVEQGIVD